LRRNHRYRRYQRKTQHHRSGCYDALFSAENLNSILHDDSP